MKTRQAWGWLMVGVVAAGLNAGYHDGGFQWAHRAVDQVMHNSAAVLALASGHADEFLAEAQLVRARHEGSSCPFSRALARTQAAAWSRAEARAIAEAQARVEQSEAGFGRFEELSAHQQAELARFEANRAQIEARIEAQTARFRVAEANVPLAFQEAGIHVDCPRIHVSVPRIPMVKIPAPVIHVENESGGPI